MNDMFDWNSRYSLSRDIEFASADEIADFQNQRLREAVGYLAQKSPFYKRLFHDNGISPAGILSVDDLQKIPFTEKSDLQCYNADFLCVAPSDIVDYITTSGTLGDPVTFACTDSDLNRLAYNEHKSFACAGVSRESVVQLMTTLDKRFMAGMAYFLGLRRLGAGVVRVGNGMPQLQWDTILRLRPDTLMCVPSFILRLVEYAEAHGIDYRNSSVKRIIGIGEGLRQSDFSLNLLGSRIHEKWPVDLYATYSSTEMGATFSECSQACGGHIHPELIIVEIIGDDNLPLPDGVPGEVVITTLGVEGMPLLRFRTGDIAARVSSPCLCGRNSYRLTPIVGRKNNMIKLKGTTLYPPAINDVLDNTPYVVNYVVEVRDSFAGTDEVIVKVGVAHDHSIDMVKDLKDRFRSRIRVAPVVQLMDPADVTAINFANNSRKPIKFIDLRQR